MRINPDEVLAERIIQKIKQLLPEITEKKITEIKNNYIKGKVSAEDWGLLAEQKSYKDGEVKNG
jgi:hypothetical protein